MRILLITILFLANSLLLHAQEEESTTYYSIEEALANKATATALNLYDPSYRVDSTLWDKLPELTNLKSITFREDRAFNKLPPSLFELHQLEELIIAGCRLDTIPAAIKQLKNLKKLVIKGYSLTYYPEIINQLTNLVHLEVSQIYKTKVLPESMGNLKKIKYLILNETALTELPTALKKMKQLEELTINEGKFTALPVVINQLKSLKKLCISSSKITTTPEFSPRLKQLESINLEFNKLANFPTSILQLPALKELSLTGNEGIQIPQKFEPHHSPLQSVAIGYCDLKQFPTAFSSFSQLETLEARRNNFAVITKEEVNSFQQLKKLDLYKSGIQRIEEGVNFGQNLQELNLMLNELKVLPNSIFESKQLKDINAAFCYITALPITLEQLENLEKVDFKYNQLQQIPFELQKRLGKELHILGNPFTITRDEKMKEIAATKATVTDSRDGQKYPIVTIDGSTWMAAHLNYETENSILDTLIEDNGRMYQKSEYNQVCPAGWHTATTADWRKLVKVVYQYFQPDPDEWNNERTAKGRIAYESNLEDPFIIFDPTEPITTSFGQIGAYFVGKNCVRGFNRFPHSDFLGLNIVSRTYAREKNAYKPSSTTIYFPCPKEDQKWDMMIINAKISRHEMRLILDWEARKNNHYHLRCVQDE